MSNFYNKYQTLKTEQEQDEFLKAGIGKILDQEFEADLQNELKVQHGITKNKKRSAPINIKIWLSAAAAILMIVLAIGIFTQKETPSKMASNFLNQEQIFHPGQLKGVGDATAENRTIAIAAFDAADYNKAADLFYSIENPGVEDEYYTALSNLLAGAYPKAIERFKTILQKSAQSYSEEINWYLSLAYVLNKQPNQALEQLGKIEPGHWNYARANQLKSSLF